MKTPLLTYSWLAALMIYGTAAELDEKSSRYHDMLLKKPESTAVLSRFIDAWLETADQSALTDILKEKAQAGGAADWRVLAAFYEFSGNDSEAIIALDAAVKAAPDDKTTRLARAKLLGKLLLFERAIEDLTEAIKDPNLELEATTLTGRFLARSGQPEKAVESWTKLIAAHPEDIGLQEDLLDLLIEENLMDQAIATSKKLTEGTKDPYQKAIRRLRTAQIYSLANKKNEAATEYQEILGISAQDSWLERETLALANKLFIAQDDSAGWQKFLEDAIAATPKRTALQENMAQHLLTTGKVDEAVAVYRNLIQTNPGVRGLREALINLLEQANKIKEASEELTALLDQNPNEPQLWERLASIHQKLGDHKATSAAVNKAAALMTQDEAGKIQSAQLYLRFQFKEASEIILRSAAKEFGPLSEAADNLAVFLATNGKAEEAVKLWVEASKKADREALLRISRSLSAHGKPVEAYQIIADREKEFADDSLVLTALCQAAQLTENSAQAIPAALTLVKLSVAATDIENSVKVASALILRCEKSDEVVQQLNANASASLGELCLLAQLHELTGDTISSEKAIAAAALKDETLAAAAMRVTLLETRGDLNGAVKAMRELTAKPGGNKPHFLKRLVDLLENSGDIPAALVEVAKWKTIAPGDKAAWLKHAELFSASGEPELATTELRRACAKFGNDEEMRQKLVNSQLDAGAHTDALRILLQLHDEAESTTTKIKYAGQIATTSMVEGRAEEIEQLFRKRSRDNPTAVAPLLVLREMLITWQRNDEASELLQEASRRKPDDIDLQAQLAELYESQGEIEKAETLLQSLIAKHNTVDVKRRLAAFYTRNGYADKAQALTKDLALNSSDARQIETIAVSMISTKQSAQAIEMLRTASAKFPLDWRISYLYAYALELNDKPEEAFQAFLALSQIQQEIPNFVAPLQPQNNAYNPYYGYNPYYNNFQGAASGNDLNAQLQLFTRTPREAYLQENQYGYRYGGAQPMQLQLPSDAKTLRRYALVHALTITKKGKEELAEERLKQLRSQEFPFWNAFVKMAMTDDVDKYPALLEESPLDPYLVKMVIRYSNSRYDRQGNLLNSNIKQETWQKISAQLAEKDPTTAFEALDASYKGIANKDHTKEEWQKMLDLLSRIPAKERMEHISLYQQMMTDREGLQISPEQWTQIETLVDETLKAHGDNQQYQLKKLAESIEKSSLAGEYVKAAEASNEFIKLADKLKQSNPYYNYQQQQYYQSQGYSSLERIWAERATPITPQQLIGQFSYEGLISQATSNGVKFLQAYIPNRAPVQPKLSPARTELMKALKVDTKTTKAPEIPAKLDIKDPKAFLDGIMKLDRPLDRVLALYACQLPALLDPLLVQLTSDEAKPDDKLLLWASAYQATDKKNLPLAYELAVKARNVAKRDLQSTADQQIILLATLLLAEKDNKVDVSAAKSALLRLSKSIVDPDQKPIAAKKLKAFGLDIAAERIVRPAIVRNRNNPNMHSYFGSGVNQKTTQDAATLARKGNRAGAATRIYQQIRQIFQQQQGNQSYYLRQIKEVVSAVKLEKDIATQMRPVATASFRERVEFMRVMCAIDKPENYAAELKALYQENPQDANLLNLMTLIADDELRLDIAMRFTQLDPSEMVMYGNSLIQEFNDNDGSMDDKMYSAYLSRFELIISILEAQPTEQKSPNTLTWINTIISQLLGEHYVNGDNLRSFNTPPPAAPKIDNPLCVKRDEIIHRMALAMIKHKDTSNTGFSVLQTGKTLWKLDDKALQDIAMVTYKKMLASMSFAAPPKKASYNSFLQLDTNDPFDQVSRSYINSGYSQGGQNTIHATIAATTATNPLKKEDLLPSLKENERKLVESWLSFMETPATDQTAERTKSMQENNAAFLVSLEIARLLNLQILPAMDLLLHHKDAATAKQDGFQAPDMQLIQQLIDQAVQAKSQQEFESIITQVTERYLGEKKLWPLYELTSNRSQRNSYSTEIDTRLQQYTSIINQQQNQSTNCRIKRFLLANQMGQLSQNSNQVRLDDNAKNNAELIINSGLVQSGPGMFLVDGSFLPDKLLYFSYSSSENTEEKELAKELEKIDGENRFWSRLIAARYKQAKGAEILPEITREMKAIKTWPESEKTLFANWLYQTWPDLTSSSLRSWLKPDLRGNLVKHEKAIKELPNQVETQSYDQEEILNSLCALINDDPKKTAELWISVMETCSKLNLSSNSSVNGVALAPHEYLNYSIIQNFQYSSSGQKVDRFKTLQFLVALDQAKFVMPRNYSIPSILRDVVRRTVSDSTNTTISPTLSSISNKSVASVAQLILYSSSLDNKTAMMIMNSMVDLNDYISTPDAKTLEFLKSWLEKTIAPKNPRLAKFGYIFFYTNHNSFNVEKIKKQCIATHLELYQDKELDSTFKLKCFSELAETSEDIYKNQELMSSIMNFIMESDLNDESQFSVVYSSIRNISARSNMTPEINARLCSEIYPKLHQAIMNHPNYRQNYDASITQSWLQSAVKSGDKKLFTDYIRLNPDDSRGNLECLVDLMKNDWTEEAINLLPKPGVMYQIPLGLLVNNGNGSRHLFTPDLEQKLAKFLPNIKDVQQRYRFEAMVANLRDGQNKDKPTTDRTKRLIALANRFAAEAPPQRAMRMELLCFLDSGSNYVNLEEMLTHANALDFADVLEARFNRNGVVPPAEQQLLAVQQAMIERTMSATLRDNKNEYFMRQMKSLSQLHSANNYYAVAQVLQSNLTYLGPYILNQLLEKPQEQQKLANELIDICTNSMEMSAQNSSDGVHSIYLFSQMAHSLSGQGKKFAAWDEQLSARSKARLKQNKDYYFGQIFRSMGKQFIVDSAGKSNVPKLLTKLLSDDETSRLFISHATMLSSLMDQQFVSIDQLRQAIENVPDTCVRKPEYLTERAGIIGWRKKDFAAAEKDYDRARELATSMKLDSAFEAAKAYQARMYGDNGKKAEAEKLAATVDVSKLSDKDKKFFAPLAKFAKPAPKEVPPATKETP